MFLLFSLQLKQTNMFANVSTVREELFPLPTRAVASRYPLIHCETPRDLAFAASTQSSFTHPWSMVVCTVTWKSWAMSINSFRMDKHFPNPSRWRLRCRKTSIKARILSFFTDVSVKPRVISRGRTSRIHRPCFRLSTPSRSLWPYITSHICSLSKAHSHFLENFTSPVSTIGWNYFGSWFSPEPIRWLPIPATFA